MRTGGSPSHAAWEECQGCQESAAADDEGVTIIELVLVVAILTALAGLAVPAYLNARDRAMNVKAIADISVIQRDIARYVVERGGLPWTLGQVGGALPRDPWGNPYRYLNFETLAKDTNQDKGSGKDQTQDQPKEKPRKDRFLVPINSTFDLYSMGRDGLTNEPLTAKVSRDDIVRANDGAFIGLAEDF